MINESYMQHAIALAAQAQGYTNPNPLVGAVIVKNNQIIGEGYHQKAGGPHAERVALAHCSESPAGAVLYVTLEPCCHHGRTPPCTEAIIQAGISHVVIGSADPNPLVRGKGAAQLRAAGILVTEGFLKDACDALNPIFFHYITTGLPYVALKYAMTADGKIATCAGASRWISNEASRRHAHSLRHRYSAILVGSETVLQDDPLLNCRMENGKQPLRIVCDSRLRIPLDSRICQTAGTYPTVIAYAADNPEKQKALAEMGISLWKLPAADGRVSLPHLMKRLGENGIDSVLAEGGAAIHFSLLEARLAQKLYIYLAPKIFGGTQAKSPVGGSGIAAVENAYALQLCRCEEMAGDLLLDYTIKKT